jgi:hypothetical protein
MMQFFFQPDDTNRQAKMAYADTRMPAYLPQIYDDDWVSATEMAERHPLTFKAPTADEIAALVPGSSVKICNTSERFWATILARRDHAFLGRVANHLAFPAFYKCGDLIEFKDTHVFATMTPEETDLASEIVKTAPITENLRRIDRYANTPSPASHRAA